MTADRLRQAFSLLFVLGFFTFLFGPLIIMSLTAFNSSAFPRVSPWECFSVEWFKVLANDDRLLTGLRNSLLIGFGVVCVSVPTGLAAALMLTQVKERVRPWYYTLVISPILVPGVVLGISTLLFWDRVGVMFGTSRESIFYDGFFLTIIGQSTFITAYAMLIFISRLQRFDRGLEEAALDLGATHWQAFRKILLPFLKPAIGSAAVLAFLASFENYNTTVFTAISTSTLTTVLASKVRYGINPSISALAVVIVALTLVGAAVHEVLKRREIRAEAAREAVADKGRAPSPQRPWFREPALIMILLVVIAGTGTMYMAGTVGVEECKVIALEEKRERTRQRTEQMRERRAAEAERRALEAEQNATENVEAPDNEPAEDTGGDTAPSEPRQGTENFNSIFSTDNLAPPGGAGQDEDATDNDAPADEDTPADGPPVTSPAPGTQNFEGIFNSDNLSPGQ